MWQRKRPEKQKRLSSSWHEHTQNHLEPFTYPGPYSWSRRGPQHKMSCKDALDLSTGLFLGAFSFSRFPFQTANDLSGRHCFFFRNALILKRLQRHVLFSVWFQTKNALMIVRVIQVQWALYTNPHSSLLHWECRAKAPKITTGPVAISPLTASELLVHDAQLKPLVTSSHGAICPHLASSRSCHGSPRIGRICTAAWGSTSLGQCPHNEHCHVGNHPPPGRTAHHGPSVDLPASNVGMAAPPSIHE